MKFETLEQINKLIVKEKEQASYYITLDNEDKTKEVVFYLDCTLEDAREVFRYVIKEQQKVYRKSNYKIKWRVVRLFNSNNELLAQES